MDIDGYEESIWKMAASTHVFQMKHKMKNIFIPAVGMLCMP
jgi:hypothetical protein